MMNGWVGGDRNPPAQYLLLVSRRGFLLRLAGHGRRKRNQQDQ